MVDVNIYGHLTFDRIFNGFKYDASVGSMGNVWKYLNLINPYLNIKLTPTELGEAVIMLNKHNSERSSVANLSLYSQPPVIVPAKWNHVMYLNELVDTKFVANLSGLTSADVCRGSTIKDLSILNHIDFLFISDEDLFTDMEEILKAIRKAVIYHTKSGSSVYVKSHPTIHTKVEVLDNINVLGAGDMLASCFINEFLISSDLKCSIKNAHKNVSYLLKKQIYED